uniref:Uncharacterized protein n=1 Tax=Arundo donax TaxID=35708 RepID=A0A0A9DSD4_ARUDO
MVLPSIPLVISRAHVQGT